MTSENKVPSLANMTTKQKATAGVVVVIILILLWQLSSMFGGSKKSTKVTVAKPVTAAKAVGAAPGATQGVAMPNEETMKPKPAELAMAQPLSEREAELVRLQQETQTRYLQALSDLQMLKLQRDIALTNKDISTAKLATVQSEKKIVDLLTPPAPPPVSEAITKQVTPVSQMEAGEQNVKYSVVSVSQLQYRWAAVIGYKGNLFNVRVGDVLPPDGSTVETINSDGVILTKDGVKTKVSLVPAI